MEPLVAALMSLAQSNVPPDVQALLVEGDGRGSVAPGALARAIEAAMDAAEEAERVANTCDVPGCGQTISAGWPVLGGYRRTCHAHWAERCGACP